MSKVAIVYERRPRITSLEKFMRHRKVCELFSAFRDFLKRIKQYRKTGLTIAHYSVNDFLSKDPASFNKIAIDGYVGRTSQVERELIHRADPSVLERIVNLSGESLVREALEGKSSLGSISVLSPEIFAGNKALAYHLLDGNPVLIPLHALGYESERYRNTRFPERDLIAKPTQGSEGQGVRKVQGESFPFFHIDGEWFGSEMVQDYISQDTVVELRRPSDIRIIITRWGQEYRYHGMVRTGGVEELASNLTSGGFGIALGPNRFVSDPLHRDALSLNGIDPNNPLIPQEILAHSQAIASVFGYPVLGLDFIKEEGGGYKLLEANSYPGERIFYYLGLTANSILDDFVRQEGLLEEINPKIEDKTPRVELAKAKIIKMIHVVKAHGLDTHLAEEALGLDPQAIIGTNYPVYSLAPANHQPLLEGNLSPFGPVRFSFRGSLLERYLVACGVPKGDLAPDGRGKVLRTILYRNQVPKPGRRVGLAQGIVSTYADLAPEFNRALGLLPDENMLDGTNASANITKATAFLMQQAVEAQGDMTY